MVRNENKISIRGEQSPDSRTVDAVNWPPMDEIT